MTYGLKEACEKVREASQGAQIILLPRLFENWYFTIRKKLRELPFSDNTRGKFGGPRDADHCP